MLIEWTLEEGPTRNEQQCVCTFLYVYVHMCACMYVHWCCLGMKLSHMLRRRVGTYVCRRRDVHAAHT